MSDLRNRAAEATGGAIEKRPDPQQQGEGGIARFINDLRPQIERALPETMSATRMARLALTEVRKNPKLAECTPASVAGSLLTAAALGLEIGTTGEAYIVPYEHHSGAMRGQTECQFQVGYQGFTKLFYQHPLAADIDAQAVYEADDFDYAYGTDKFLRHRPSKAKGTDRGEVIYYYAVAYLTTGATHFVVLTPDEVKALRGGKVGPQGRIADPQLWMERKTALRQCLKVLPKSTTLTAALAAEDATGSELYRARVTDQQITTAVAEIGPTEQPAEQHVVTHPDGAQETVDGPADDDPVVPDPNDPNDPWATPMITDEQRTRIHASLGDLNITDRDKKLEFCGDVVGHAIQSTNDLTLAQASQVIEVLNSHLEAAGLPIPGGAR